MVVVGAGNSGLTFLEFIHALGPAHAYVNHSIQRGMAPKVLMLCGGEAASAPFDVCAMVVSQTGTQPLLLPCACWIDGLGADKASCAGHAPEGDTDKQQAKSYQKTSRPRYSRLASPMKSKHVRAALDSTHMSMMS